MDESFLSTSPRRYFTLPSIPQNSDFNLPPSLPPRHSCHPVKLFLFFFCSRPHTSGDVLLFWKQETLNCQKLHSSLRHHRAQPHPHSAQRSRFSTAGGGAWLLSALPPHPLHHLLLHLLLLPLLSPHRSRRTSGMGIYTGTCAFMCVCILCVCNMGRGQQYAVVAHTHKHALSHTHTYFLLIRFRPSHS